MTARPHMTIARATTAACLLGAAVGTIGRRHEIIEGFGCCGDSCHCNHALALGACALYLAGILAIVLLVGRVHRGLLCYGLLSLAAFVYLGVVPIPSVAKMSADPHELLRGLPGPLGDRVPDNGHGPLVAGAAVGEGGPNGHLA